MPTVAPGPETRVYRPVELNREVRLHLEAGFPRLWISGEISNLARPASGHLYFTIKDERAQIRCALFRSSASGLGFRPENGMQVLVRGRLSLFEPRGDYQLIADGVLEAGAGALAQAFDALKKKLEAEGLFDEAHKQALPRWPERISVVTSPSGAAIRDILQTLALRWPRARVRIYPSQVQGESAPGELIKALQAADRHAFGQLIILARGGGSLEDLWAFNDEQLARAIHACTTPIISGVGHETDFTIADFVTDLRAPTPTAAAVAASPDGPELRIHLQRLERRFGRAVEQSMQGRMQRLDFLANRLHQQHPERRLAEISRRLTELDRRGNLAIKRQTETGQRALQGLDGRMLARHPETRIERLNERISAGRLRLERAGKQAIERREQQLGGILRSLNNVSPLAVLERGYAVIRNPGGQPMTERKQFIKGSKINLLMNSFEVDAEVIDAARDAQLK